MIQITTTILVDFEKVDSVTQWWKKYILYQPIKPMFTGKDSFILIISFKK